MTAILNSAILNSAILYMLDSETAILDSDTLVKFSQIHSKRLSFHFDSESNKFNLTQTHSFSFNLMKAAILNSAILNLAILDSAILVFPLKVTLAKIGSHHLHKKRSSLIHSDSLDDGSHLDLPCWIETLPSWFRHLVIFFQIHSKTLSLHSDSSNSFWLKLNSPNLMWQPSWIWPSWIQTS